MTRPSPYKHIIESQQFTVDFLEELFTSVREIKEGKDVSAALCGKIIAMLFYEPSTRTRFSFESAAIRLGATKLTTENAREFSSASKGETLEDTIRIMDDYADMIVLRHYQDDAAHVAAAYSDVPIINAGSGKSQHPTQALLDLYTIWEEFGRLEGIDTCVVGDLYRGRTVDSLVYLLSKFKDNRFTFISPPNSRVKQGIKEHLSEHSIPYQESDTLDTASACDVLYVTRVQKERFEDPAEYEKAKGSFIVDGNFASAMKSSAIIMHPLPRVDEITIEVDSDPRARYFEQAANGVYVRMGLLLSLNES